MAGEKTADSEITKSLLRRAAFGSAEPVRSQARLKLLEILFKEEDYGAVAALSGVFLKGSLEKTGMELIVARSYYNLGDYRAIVENASAWDYETDRDLFLVVLLGNMELASPGWRGLMMKYLLNFQVERKKDSGFLLIESKLKEKKLFSSLKGSRKSLLEFKTAVERKEYRKAVLKAADYLSSVDSSSVSASVMDEIIRVSLKGSGAGIILKTVEGLLAAESSVKFQDTVTARMYWGAGYLSDKTGFQDKASRYYLKGMPYADNYFRDKLLWYWFAGRVRRSSRTAVASLDFLVSGWSDPSYFNDILSDLTDILIRSGQWEQILVLFNKLKDTADGDIVSRLSYLSARGFEENYISGPVGRKEKLFRLSMETGEGLGSGLYYKIMSMARLGGSGISVYDIFNMESAEHEDREGAYDELLYGAAEFSLLEYGKRILDRYPGKFSLSAVRFFASCLNTEGDYISSIRLLNRSLSARGYIAGREDIPVLYPDPFRGEIESICRKNDLPEPVFFALIREESHFSETIVSPAGAVGLSQLMPSTAADVASRMRIKADDLTDPAVNLELGGWYLHNLISRTGTVIQALFAYNGGLTRVRRWKSEYSSLPEDLFLEAVPYGETSLYGRKVLVSAVIYGYLYYNYRPEEIIHMIFSDNND